MFLSNNLLILDITMHTSFVLVGEAIVIVVCISGCLFRNCLLLLVVAIDTFKGTVPLLVWKIERTSSLHLLLNAIIQNAAVAVVVDDVARVVVLSRCVCICCRLLLLVVLCWYVVELEYLLLTMRIACVWCRQVMWCLHQRWCHWIKRKFCYW